MSDFILNAPRHIVEKIFNYSSIETRHSFLLAYGRHAVISSYDKTFHVIEKHIHVPDGRDWQVVGRTELFRRDPWLNVIIYLKGFLPDSTIYHLMKAQETEWPCYICMSNTMAHDFGNPNRFRTLGSQMFFEAYESEDWTLHTRGRGSSLRMSKDRIEKFSDNAHQLNYFFDKLHQCPSFESFIHLKNHLAEDHDPFPYQPELVRRERIVGMKILRDAISSGTKFSNYLL